MLDRHATIGEGILPRHARKEPGISLHRVLAGKAGREITQQDILGIGDPIAYNATDRQRYRADS